MILEDSMAWIVKLVITGEDGETPAAGVSIRAATPGNPELAVTDDAGVATITLEKTPTEQLGMFISGTPFTIQRPPLANRLIVDRAVYDQLKKGLPVIPEENRTSLNVHYAVTDSDSGQKLTVPAVNPMAAVRPPNPLSSTSRTRSADSSAGVNGELEVLLEVVDVTGINVNVDETDTNNIISLADFGANASITTFGL